MPEATDTGLCDKANQFRKMCETLGKTEILDDMIRSLLGLWNTFQNEYSSYSTVDADKCLESILICTAQLVFNLRYIREVSSDSKLELKEIIRSCGNTVQESTHRKKLLNGISSIIESPWSAANFLDVVLGAKSKQDNKASDELWNTEGWLMLENRIDFMTKVGKSSERAFHVLNVLVEKGHEIFQKNGHPKSITESNYFHPYIFSYRKYVEYLEVYAILQFKRFVETEIVDIWDESLLHDVISSLIEKSQDHNKTRLFPNLKQWKDVDNAALCFAKKATVRALNSSTSTLLEDFFMKWMNVSGCGVNGMELSESTTPIDEILQKDISCTKNIYKIANIVKSMGDTLFTRKKYLELFMWAMPKDNSIIEELKLRNKLTADAKVKLTINERIEEEEKKLSIRYLDLAKHFRDYPKTAKGCLITAFSLMPCPKLFDYLFPISVWDTDNISQFENEHKRIAAEYDIIKDFHLEETAWTVLDDQDALGLSGVAYNDLATIIDVPRFKGFRELNRSNEELRDGCRRLLESKNVAVFDKKALDFLRIDYDKCKDFKPQYDPEDDGIENGYRYGEKRIRTLLPKRALGGTSKVRKIAFQRARKLPPLSIDVNLAGGVRKKGRPPKVKPEGQGDDYNSVSANDHKMPEEIRKIPNVCMNQNPWFAQWAPGGFYTEFYHTCFHVTDPCYKEKSYGRNFPLEERLLKTVVSRFHKNGINTESRVAEESRVGENTSAADKGTSSDDKEVATFVVEHNDYADGTMGQMPNAGVDPSNMQPQGPNERINPDSINEHFMNNTSPFYDDPCGGALRSIVYQYTVSQAKIRAVTERERNNFNSMCNKIEAEKLNRGAAKMDRKRKKDITVVAKPVSLKKPRKEPARRLRKVCEDISDKTGEPQSDNNIPNTSKDDTEESAGADINLGDSIAATENLVISESPLPKPEPEFAGPFQIMGTYVKDNPDGQPESTSDRVVPIKDKITSLDAIGSVQSNQPDEQVQKPEPSLNSVVPAPRKVVLPSLPNTSTMSFQSSEKVADMNWSPTPFKSTPVLHSGSSSLIQKPLKTYSKRRLVIKTHWSGSSDRQLKEYTTAIPVEKPTNDPRSFNLNLSSQSSSSQKMNSNLPIADSASLQISFSQPTAHSILHSKPECDPNTNLIQSPGASSFASTSIPETPSITEVFINESLTLVESGKDFSESQPQNQNSRISLESIETKTNIESEHRVSLLINVKKEPLEMESTQSKSENTLKSVPTALSVAEVVTSIDSTIVAVPEDSTKNSPEITHIDVQIGMNDCNYNTLGTTEGSKEETVKIGDVDMQDNGKKLLSTDVENVEQVCEHTVKEKHDIASNKHLSEETKHLDCQQPTKFHELEKSTSLKESGTNGREINSTGIFTVKLDSLKHVSLLINRKPKTEIVQNSPMQNLTEKDFNPLAKQPGPKIATTEANSKSSGNSDSLTLVKIPSPLSSAVPSAQTSSSSSKEESVCSKLSKTEISCTLKSNENNISTKSLEPNLTMTEQFHTCSSVENPEKLGSLVANVEVSNIPNKEGYEPIEEQSVIGENDLNTDSCLLAGNIPRGPTPTPDDGCVEGAEEVIYHLLDMVDMQERAENKMKQSETKPDRPAVDEENINSILPEGVEIQREALDTTTNDIVSSSKVELTIQKCNEDCVDPPNCKSSTNMGENEFDPLPKIVESQVADAKIKSSSDYYDASEIICLDSDDDHDLVTHLNSSLLPHGECDGERKSDSESPATPSRNARSVTPVKQLEEIINQRLRRKAKRPYDEEEDWIKVADSVVKHAEKGSKPLRYLIACCVEVQRLTREEMPEKYHDHDILNPVKRSTRLKKKKMRTVEEIKNVFQSPKTNEDADVDSNEIDSDIEIVEEILNTSIKKPASNSFHAPVNNNAVMSELNFRKRKANDPQQHIDLKMLKIQAAPTNDATMCNGVGSDPDYDPESGNSTEVEDGNSIDDDFESQSGLQNCDQIFQNNVEESNQTMLYPKINCALPPEEVNIEDDDPLAIDDIISPVDLDTNGELSELNLQPIHCESESSDNDSNEGDYDVLTSRSDRVGLQRVTANKSFATLNSIPLTSIDANETQQYVLPTTLEEEDSQDVAKENFTQGDSNSDCEIIEVSSPSSAEEEPSQVLLINETRRSNTRSLPPSTTNSNSGKRVTRRSEHLIPSCRSSIRLTTDQSKFNPNSSISQDENSTDPEKVIPDANLTPEDNLYSTISSNNKPAKEAESITCDLDGDVLRGEDEEIGDMYILPDANITQFNPDYESDSNSNVCENVSVCESVQNEAPELADCSEMSGTIIQFDFKEDEDPTLNESNGDSSTMNKIAPVDNDASIDDDDSQKEITLEKTNINDFCTPEEESSTEPELIPATEVSSQNNFTPPVDESLLDVAEIPAMNSTSATPEDKREQEYDEGSYTELTQDKPTYETETTKNDFNSEAVSCDALDRDSVGENENKDLDSQIPSPTQDELNSSTDSLMEKLAEESECGQSFESCSQYTNDNNDDELNDNAQFPEDLCNTDVQDNNSLGLESVDQDSLESPGAESPTLATEDKQGFEHQYNDTCYAAEEPEPMSQEDISMDIDSVMSQIHTDEAELTKGQEETQCTSNDGENSDVDMLQINNVDDISDMDILNILQIDDDESGIENKQQEKAEMCTKVETLNGNERRGTVQHSLEASVDSILELDNYSSSESEIHIAETLNNNVSLENEDHQSSPQETVVVAEIQSESENEETLVVSLESQNVNDETLNISTHLEEIFTYKDESEESELEGNVHSPRSSDVILEEEIVAVKNGSGLEEDHPLSTPTSVHTTHWEEYVAVKKDSDVEEDECSFPPSDNINIACGESISDLQFTAITDGIANSTSSDDDKDENNKNSSPTYIELEEPGSPRLPLLTAVEDDHGRNWDSDDEPPSLDIEVFNDDLPLP